MYGKAGQASGYAGLGTRMPDESIAKRSHNLNDHIYGVDLAHTHDAYAEAPLHPDNIDAGVVILTVEALRRQNAQVIAGLSIRCPCSTRWTSGPSSTRKS